MELKDVLYQMMAENQRSSQPTELRIGTVVSTNPLSISINTAMAPLQQSVLLLTSAVVERKIPVLEHFHLYESTKETENALENLSCLENGVSLPVDGGYIILNRSLQPGDKVLLLRVQNGQKFLVLSRVFE